MKIKISNEIEADNVTEILTRTVVKSGNGASINCLKKHRGKKVIVVVVEDE